MGISDLLPPYQESEVLLKIDSFINTMAILLLTLLIYLWVLPRRRHTATHTAEALKSQSIQLPVPSCHNSFDNPTDIHVRRSTIWDVHSRRKGTSTGTQSQSQSVVDSVTADLKSIWNDATLALEVKHTHVKKRLEDMLSWSFLENRDVGDSVESIPVANAMDDVETTAIIEQDMSSDEMEQTQKQTHMQEVDARTVVTHFCFLVHGYRGKPKDLRYLRFVMKQEAQKRLRLLEGTVLELDSPELDKENDVRVTNQHERSSSNVNNKRIEAETEAKVEPVQNQNHHRSRLAIHNVKANFGKTSDGVEKGGDRVMEEILDVIRKECKHEQGRTNNGDGMIDVTLSIVGNSLGGLYSRFAVSQLFALSKASDGSILIDGCIRIHFNIFCTTATPHLGVSGQTFFPVPRSAEIAGGKLMGQTGRDIFRIESNLIKTMCTCPTFLNPLASFRKRIAYANAYQTDFVVPTQTAAFLNTDSNYPHYFESGRDGMIVATLRTDSAKGRIKEVVKKGGNEFVDTDRNPEDLLKMSNALDKLGWKKVIVDVRSQMPRITHPRHFVQRLSKLNSSFDSSDSDQTMGGKENDSLSQSVPIPSKDVLRFFSGREGENVTFPLGHNTLVAVEHQAVVSTVFKKGRPVMDKLGNELVDEILSWKPKI